MSAMTAAFAESGHGILPGMSTRPPSQAGPPMTLGNMRANGVRSLDVSSRASAIVRPAHGLHPVRNHRCRRPAELAGATGAAERRWHRAMAMSAERHRVLEILAGSSLQLHRGESAGAWLHDRSAG
jgi:hypothetical protein